MTDEETHAWYEEARVRMITPCSLCGADCYAPDAACVRPGDLVLSIPTCRNDDHGVCEACLILVMEAHVAKNGREAEHVLPCPFPFGARCRGTLALPFAHMRMLTFKCDVARETVDARCPDCAQSAQYAPALGYLHGCPHCDTQFCVRCERSCCQCKSCEVAGSDWSRYIRNSEGKPLRNRDASVSQREQIWSRAKQDCGGAHVGCITCGIRLYKDAQCNEMRHCGSVVCYSCGAAAHPWERALPSYHWDTCPRWDHEDSEAIAGGFACKEGTCYGILPGECILPEHRVGIQAYHTTRLKRYRKGVLLEMKLLG